MVVITEESNVGKKRTSQGRKKIAIEKIQNVSNRQVTFSKRRLGLFKKASELCILTNAEVAIVVHSLGKRVFVFGHPSTDAIIDRYLNEDTTNAGAHENNGRIVKGASEYNEHYLEICGKLEVEKKRKEAIEEEKRVVSANGYSEGGFWWDYEVDNMGVDELEHYAEALDELMKKVAMRANDLMLIQNSNVLSDPGSISGVESRYNIGSGSTVDDHNNGGNNNNNLGESGLGEY